VIAAEGPNPVVVEVIRGGAIESRHRGAAAVVDENGGLVASWGDIHRPIFPRSAVKPLQALPLVESRANERFAVTSEELALACASHDGTPEHVAVVRAWLDRIGLGVDALECGAHPPLSEAAAAELARRGEKPTPLHNNCSGKHAGFLTTALHLGVPTAGYSAPDHPLQLYVRRVLEEMGGVDLQDSTVAVDGCGVPVIAMPLSAIARAFVRLADWGRENPRRADSLSRIRLAMSTHPLMVAGNGRFETNIMKHFSLGVVVKGGAEGVCAAAISRRGLGIAPNAVGIAVKIDDGAKRAAETAMARLIECYVVHGHGMYNSLGPYLDQPLVNTNGIRVGRVRCASGWPK